MPAGNSTEIVKKVGAQAVGAGIGLAVGGPPGAIIGAAAVPLIELMVARSERRGRNLQAFTDSLTSISGMPPEQVAAWARQDEQRQDLVAHALEAAFAARTTRKVEALAKVVSENLRDDARLDISQMIVAALEQLESPHIRVLHVFVHESPADGPDCTWHCAGLKERLPGLADGIMPLVATLFRLGMITESTESEKDRLAWEPTRFGVTCLNYLEEPAASRRP
ncbi:hypothetical protein ACQPZX_23440 [Actinoplanes sp. CA-142083]|uniref:hypothetical protein n=1 Tax=Actinoplanes sp. CA-142083 TaxID=3239903 RepID=UPI003D8D7A17